MQNRIKNPAHSILLRGFLALIFCAMVFGLHRTAALGKVGTQAYPESFAELSKKASPSVVNIIAVKVFRGTGEGAPPL